LRNGGSARGSSARSGTLEKATLTLLRRAVELLDLLARAAQLLAAAARAASEEAPVE